MDENKNKKYLTTSNQEIYQYCFSYIISDKQNITGTKFPCVDFRQNIETYDTCKSVIF